MHRLQRFVHAVLVLVGLSGGVLSSPAAAQRPVAAGVFKSRISPHWMADGEHFWYRNDLPGGRHQYVLVNAPQGTRKPAFDHDRLAQSLRAAGVKDTQAERLDLEPLDFDFASSSFRFQRQGQAWKWNLKSYVASEVTDFLTENKASADRPATDQELPRRSRQTGDETELVFINRAPFEVELFWIDTSGERRGYGKLSAGEVKRQHTYAGHVWETVAPGGKSLGRFIGKESAQEVIIDDRVMAQASKGRASGRQKSAPRSTGRSPDGKWTAFVKDHNVFLQGTRDDQELQLSEDGHEGSAYGMLEWSPDSATLVAFRIKAVERKNVYLVESSPRGGGRAVFHQRPYAMPGDEFPSCELRLFSVARQAAIDCRVDSIDFGTPRIRFRSSGRTLTYEQVSRGHQRFRLIEVDLRTGDSRNIIDEQSQTFIWTAHRESIGLAPVTWLEETDELIYPSERDGWRHLYLIDAREGVVKHQITSGPYVVRGIEHIDEQARQVWFRASGMNADQDPYFVHYYRVNFDGTGLVALTAGDGNHTVQFSPDRKYLIDTYSRVDQPPAHELRRTTDGTLVCELEAADISELQAGGWEPPEVFSAKGRDGITDIWGLICRPRDFDPNKKYPVIEQIYAGPHGSFVPKSFSAQRRFAALTDLGFVVVQIDGMGTANRSKAFHDVCWQNLKDAGLPDRILWHKAAAAKHAWYDINRVGIYGTSAGGQNSTAALLFHSAFYKAGVSACGCHDNRLDKASWNEQWMGYPVGPHYSQCSNIDNAWRLEGQLLLIVGEMDTNVPPESTLRLADALIKADKDFELLVVPGAGHGMGGAYGTRRMHQFFVRHLLGSDIQGRTSRDP